jgi:predicted phage terminase large subunit-like protein
MRTHTEVIVAAGGQTRLARALGVSVFVVNAWRFREVIPPKYWPMLVKAGLATRAELSSAAEARRQVMARKADRTVKRPKGDWRAGVLKPLSPVRGAAARQRLAVFCKIIEVPGVDRRRPGGPPHLGAHHRLWLNRLEALERGEILRLMCFMPPGSAKSTYAVDVFTPWFMARAPNRSVLVATYASSLAKRRGRKARSVARQPVFGQIFGQTITGRAGAADAWSLTNGSDWMGAGMLAGITGNRADLIVIDDPVKGRNAADSPLIRRRTREEFDDTVRTRLKSGGRIVLIQTRWHEEDLAGGLLPQDYDGRSGPVLCRDGEWWEVVNIPAQAERDDDPLGRAKGQYLWPEYWPESHWPQFKVNPRTWNALFQQRPKPEEGSYFERSRFGRFKAQQLPKVLRYYGSSDYAVSEGKGDFTRLTVWGIDEAMTLWRVDSWGGQTTADQWIEHQAELIAKYRPLGGIRTWYGEAGVIQKAIEPMLKAKLQAMRLSCPLQWLASAQDKTTRARAAQSLVREGRVMVKDDADGDCFIDECVAFPAGRHDDEVDCLSLMGRVLDRLRTPASAPREEFAESGRVFED